MKKFVNANRGFELGVRGLKQPSSHRKQQQGVQRCADRGCHIVVNQAGTQSSIKLLLMTVTLEFSCLSIGRYAARGSGRWSNAKCCAILAWRGNRDGAGGVAALKTDGGWRPVGAMSGRPIRVKTQKGLEPEAGAEFKLARGKFYAKSGNLQTWDSENRVRRGWQRA